MRVIGTAGHVDHGKSTLVQALTGIHPDRLKEEQEREMTIDLGFAWFTLPGGEEVGVVDVPGHRDFIENMLAGIGGIDAAILVIAADEGIMPQTQEHLAILDLLSINGGVIAITKVDLINDAEWLDLVEEEIHQVTRDTVLAEAPVVRVSARTGNGLEELLSALEAVLAGQPGRPDLKRPRLPVDRVFTITGFGTVVTGTLGDGILRVGDEVAVLPSGKRGRIRGIQSHKRKSELAMPGSRTAVNLSGLDHSDLLRGDVVTHPGNYLTTRRIDARMRVLADVDFPLKHNSNAKLFIGASEVMARVRILGSEEIQPGQTGWLQIELVDPIVGVRGDRFILRRPSPANTIGGGIIVDPHPNRRHKRHDQRVIERLEALAEGDPADILEQTLLAAGIAPLKTILTNSKLDTEMSQLAVSKLLAENRLFFLEGDPAPNLQNEQYVTSPAYWNQMLNNAEQILADFHRAAPLRSGMPREEYKSKLRLPARQYNLVLKKLIELQAVIEQDGSLRLPAHQILFSPQQKQAINQLFFAFGQNPYNPPSVKEAENMVGPEVYRALLETRQLIQISPDVVYTPEIYQDLRDRVIKYIQDENQVTVAQVRDLFQTSRKFALALLEHLDAVGITIRQGDYRKLKG